MRHCLGTCRSNESRHYATPVLTRLQPSCHKNAVALQFFGKLSRAHRTAWGTNRRYRVAVPRPRKSKRPEMLSRNVQIKSFRTTVGFRNTPVRRKVGKAGRGSSCAESHGARQVTDALVIFTL